MPFFAYYTKSVQYVGRNNTIGKLSTLYQIGQGADVNFLMFNTINIGKTKLGNPPRQRHLPTLETGRLTEVTTGLVTLMAPCGRTTMARSGTTANPLFRVTRSCCRLNISYVFHGSLVLYFFYGYQMPDTLHHAKNLRIPWLDGCVARTSQAQCLDGGLVFLK
ncbi:MAG: hypothetical protein UZ06_CHB003000085 [Chlorobi bacterium OLB6]|nr:MAG: hypothetical protein UZ06_CHB003000085 [Chlorobi bacterium OLB6]